MILDGYQGSALLWFQAPSRDHGTPHAGTYQPDGNASACKHAKNTAQSALDLAKVVSVPYFSRRYYRQGSKVAESITNRCC
jgi:hypothetical protein